MKKLILFFVFMFVVTASYSQLFNIGVKFGYNSSLSFSSLNDRIDYTYKNAFQEIGNNFQAGVFGRLYFHKLYIQPELLYSLEKRNYTISDGTDNSTYNGMVKTSSIDIPVLVGYKIFELKRILNIRAFAGPKFRIDAGSDVNFGDITPDIASAAVGLDVGVGIDVLMLTFDVRYSLINNLYDTPEQIKNGIPASNFIFSLGWKIL